MPENTPATQSVPQTISLGDIAQPEKKETFFDKQMKRFAWFIAKVTGQPDPQTGAVNMPNASMNPLNSEIQTQQFIPSQLPMTQEMQASVQWTPIQNSNAQQQVGATQQAPQQPVQSKEPSFFEKLVATTQGLLNKTQEVANNIVEKTTNFTNTVVNTTQAVSNKIVTTTWNLAQTVASAPTKVADTVQWVADKTQEITSNIVASGKDLWTGIVSTTQNTIAWVKNTTVNIVNNPVGTVQNTVSQVASGAQNLGQNAMQAGEKLAQNIQEKVASQGQGKGFIQQVNQGIWNIVEKTKEIWTSAVENTKSFIQNPMEKIDSLAGSWAAIPPVQTETANTTALDNLASASSVAPVQQEQTPSSVPSEVSTLEVSQQQIPSEKISQ